MANPKIDLPKDPLDHLLLGITIFATLFLVGYPSIHFGNLPDKVPVHFGPDGLPDRYGSKSEIWIIPVIGLAMIALLRGLARYPHTFNYVVKITKDNAKAQYGWAVRLMQSLAALITILMAYITYTSIRVGLGDQVGLGKFFLPLFVVSIFVTIGYFFGKSFKKE